MSSRATTTFTTPFAEYTLAQQIGQGGTGYIYKVTDEEGKQFALKLLDQSRTSRDKIKRFKNELNFCLKNRHANILTITDFGNIKDGQQSEMFYVMPLFDGSLRGLMRSGISKDKVLSYFSQVLDGVEAAHLQGVVHRDLKPENVFYDEQGDRLLIADFGIAQFQEDEIYTAVVTRDGERLANFQYAAPEQRARGMEVDQRTDIYALGLILNELFTGQVPQGDGYQTIGGIAEEYAYLDELVTQMIQQTPSARPDSIEVIKQQLIGRKNEFITLQRLSELQETVIPVTEIDDPIIADPMRLIDFDWDRDKLTLILNHSVNDKWRNALLNMGSHSAALGKGPEVFTFSGNKAVISAQERDVQRIIGHFKDWLPLAHRVYERNITREKQQAEERKRQELAQEIERQEARQRVLRNTTI